MTISDQLSAFAAELTYDRIPPTVRERAKHLILDAIGIAYASGTYDFARSALAGAESLGSGDSDVFGLGRQLPLRDAIMVNGILVHGLDYDDTYLPGSMHVSASSVPTALGVGAHTGASGRDMLTACVIGLEVGARLAQAGCGSFQRAGFHPTGVCAAFSSALVSGRLMGLSPQQLSMAQGIALSTAGGTMEPLQDGSWTKRMHPGLAGAAVVTAASFAKAGYIGPGAAYEGRFGFYNVHLGAFSADADLGLITVGLGEDWQFVRTSIKRYPACHHVHAFLNATLALAREHAIAPDTIRSVHTLVEKTAIPLICEPHEAKIRPESSYIAQFSLQYSIACCLARGRFGLTELEPAARNDPALTALASTVRFAVDTDSPYPKFRAGDVTVELKDGRTLHRLEKILPDEPAADADIVAKFMDNARMAASAPHAAKVRDLLLAIEQETDLRRVTRMLGER
ncbi:MAG: MmgE/PrpD family protein [Burkholderiales bacterium]